MSIFAKKAEVVEPKTEINLGTPPAVNNTVYGITDAIQLLRGLPSEQNSELVIRVVRATLASLDVHLPNIIEDASRRQKATTERIAAVHGQMAELERQLEAHRRDIAALETDLKETTAVKERLQQAEKTATLAAGPPRLPPRPTPPQATPTLEQLKD
jgi:phage shock protein A